jgi:cobalt-zinc-cadmium efflux system membrane fusion protein
MKMHAQFIPILILVIFSSASCMNKSANNKNVEGDRNQASLKDANENHINHSDSEKEIGEVHLSELKFNSLGIKVGNIPTRALSGVVNVNGWLELFPQHKAVITSVLGANITEIKVIEGEKVTINQILAYLSHPNLINLQTAYISTYNQQQFLEKEYHRQQRLYDEKVGSGKIYQQTKANYQTIKSEVKGYEAQLKQLGLDVKKLKNGNISQYVPIVSPIDGYIEKILVQTGQFVDPQTQILSIINNDFIHADLMVFEKDVHKVKKGQKVSFTVESVPDKNLSATIFSVEKNFERNPRVVRVHAEIDQKEYSLIPGMYIHGEIYTGNSSVTALPEEAIVVENGKPYIFLVEKTKKNEEIEWIFNPIEIRTGISNQGWVEIKLLEPLTENTKVALNSAYYLIAEMKKGEISHEH